MTTTMPDGPDDPEWTEIVFPSDLGELRNVQDVLEGALQAHAFGERDIFQVRLALEEALVNAVKHGNQMDADKTVRVQYRFPGGRFEVRITDEGEGFDPADVPDPTAFENIERPCGRGVHLIRHFMTSVDYRGRGNVCEMSKVRSAPEADEEDE